jgi:hypothetical protein
MKKIGLILVLFALALLIIAPGVTAEEEHEHGEVEAHSGGTTEIILDTLVVITIAVGIWFGLASLKIFGGTVGKSFKYVFAGLGVFAFNQIILALHHVNVSLLSFLGEAQHELAHHFIVLIAFALIGYGFYRLSKSIGK